MTDTLPDLRLIIAESMEALADARLAQARRSDPADLHGEPARWWLAKRAAETLRWCAEREAPSYEELQAEIERLEDVVDAVDAAINEPGATMARRMQAIREAVA